LEKVGEATDKALKVISSGLKFLGFDKATKGVDDFTGAVKESIKVSQDLAAAELQLEKSQRKARLTQLEYQKEAEKFRQIRDDENRTIAERIKAKDALGATLKRQLKDELAIAETALKVANLRIKAEGSTKANLDAQADALTEIADIQERITGQESEQLANRVSLQKEAADKLKAIQEEQRARAEKAQQNAIKNAQNEIEILKLKAAASNLTTEQQLDNAQKVFDLETSLAKKSTSGSDQVKALLEARQNLSSSILSITEDQINKEIEQQRRVADAQKATTAEIYDAQTQSAEDLAAAQIARLDKALLSEKDYADEVIKINHAKNETLTTIQANFDEAEKVIIGNATLYHGDCLEIMPTLGAVDHIIADPPYEARLHAAKCHEADLRKDGGPKLQAIDFTCIDPIRAEFVQTSSTMCKGWFMAFCTSEGIAKWADEVNSSAMKYKRACHWIKPDSTPQLNGQGPAQGAEHFVCAWAGTGHAKWNAGGKRGVYTHLVNNPDRTGLHPTEKPVSLMAELLTDFTNEGQTILDPFMGSGTTGVAAVRMGRKFIGIEQNEEYFELACRRLAAAQSGARGFARQARDERQTDIFEVAA